MADNRLIVGGKIAAVFSISQRPISDTDIICARSITIKHSHIHKMKPNMIIDVGSCMIGWSGGFSCCLLAADFVDNMLWRARAHICLRMWMPVLSAYRPMLAQERRGEKWPKQAMKGTRRVTESTQLHELPEEKTMRSNTSDSCARSIRASLPLPVLLHMKWNELQLCCVC